MIKFNKNSQNEAPPDQRNQNGCAKISKSPLVSVIIPVYNCETYIAQTIESVLDQTYPFVELLLVDDGSTDNTDAIIKKYLNEDRVRYIKQVNGGVCKARNRGIHEAKGEYLCLLDHDDYWHPEKLSTQVKVLVENPDAGLVYSNFMLWFPDSATNKYKPARQLFDQNSLSDDIDSDYSGWIYHLLLLDCWVLTSTAMIRSSVFHECGYFDEELPYSEDWDLWLRASRKFPFIKLFCSTTLYRQHIRQGNRKVRHKDYRTVLLMKAKKKWGFCSPDGSCLQPWRFRQQMARYHTEFGLHHLRNGGSQVVAIRSFVKAWMAFPMHWKPIALMGAALMGWKPS